MPLSKEQQAELQKEFFSPSASPGSNGLEERFARTRAISGTSEPQTGVERTSVTETTGEVEEPKKQGRISGFIKGVGKGALSTFRGASALGQRGFEAGLRTILPKAAEASFGVDKPTGITSAEEAIPKHLVTPVTGAEKVGFFSEQIAEYLYPGTLTAKGIKAFGLAGAKKLALTAATEAGVTGGVTAVQRGTEEDVAKESLKAGAIGAVAVPGLAAAGNLVKRFLGSFGKNLAGVASGKGSEVIERVLADPKAARVGLRSGETEVLEQMVQKAKVGVTDLKSQSQKAYSSVLDSLPTENMSSAKEIVDEITPLLASRDVAITEKGLNITGAFSDAEEKLITRAFNKIKTQKDFSPKAMNDLAIKLGNFRKGTQDSKNFDVIIDGIKRKVREIIGNKYPEMVDINKSFGATEDFLEAIKTSIGIQPGKKLSSSDLIKVSRKIQNLFTSNKELARQFVDTLDPEIASIEAGRQLSQGVTRASASIGDAARSLLQVVIPKGAIGEVVAATGVAKQKIAPLFSALEKMAPAERLAVISALIAGREDEQE